VLRNRRLRSRSDALRFSSSHISRSDALRFSSSSIKIRRAEKSSSRLRFDKLYYRHQIRRVLLSSLNSDSDLIKLHRVEYFLVFLLSLILLFVSLFSRMKEISSFAFARKLIVLTLTSTIYNVWIFEVKNITVRSRVWEYVNSKKSESESLMLKYSRFFDFVKIVSVSILVHISTSTQDEYRLSASATIVIDNVSLSLILILEFCSNYENFFESQKRSYDVKKRAYRYI
jgi:hypothetical protein